MGYTMNPTRNDKRILTGYPTRNDKGENRTGNPTRSYTGILTSNTIRNDKEILAGNPTVNDKVTYKGIIL
jgi:hypothetical protein